MIQVDPENLAQLVGTLDDPIVWHLSGTRMGRAGCEWRHIVLTQRVRADLLRYFGADWLTRHLRDQQMDMLAWERETVPNESSQ